MKKIVDLLENQVEWIVLGLSLLFVCYSAYAYLLQPPITVTLEPSDPPRYPGELDRRIREGPVADLESRMSGGANVTVPTPPSYAAQFKDSMNYASEPPKPMAVASLVLPRTPKVTIVEPTPTPSGDPVAPTNVTGPRQTGAAVGELPKIPPARMAESRQGNSYVVPGPPPAVGMAFDLTGGMDKGWVTIRYELDVAAIAAAFDAAKIPERNANTAVLEVVLERQERQSDGSWSPTTPVGTVQVNQMETLPPTGSEAKRNLEYSKWAALHQRDILQPMFYTVAKGDPWAPPGVQIAEGHLATEKFDPARYLNATPAERLKLTPEQRRLVTQEEQKRKAPARGARRGPAPGQRGGGNTIVETPAPSQAPMDPDRPNSYQARGGGLGAPIEEVEQPNPDAPPAPTPAAAAAAMAQANSYKPEDFPLPSAELDLKKWLLEHPTKTTLVGWAHDDNVEASKTYKYRITYKVKNPVYLANNIVRDPKLAEPFYLESAPSDWSDSIEIRSAIDFWVARARPSTNTASIHIFRRQGGDLKNKVFDLNPGDMIGGKDGDTDYSTDWTLVDVLADPRSQEVYVLLMDKYGGLHRRDVKTDSTNPDFQRAKAQAAGISMAK